MSTDWNKYAEPMDTRNRAQSSQPEDNWVISLPVFRVRNLYRQVVTHTPRFVEPEDVANPNNRAHTDISGPKSPKEVATPEERSLVLQVRSEYQDMAQWEIGPADAVEQ